MVVTERGYGKMSPLEEYRLSNRGGKGVKTINATERNGQIVALRAVNGDEDLIIILFSFFKELKVSLSDTFNSILLQIYLLLFQQLFQLPLLKIPCFLHLL